MTSLAARARRVINAANRDTDNPTALANGAAVAEAQRYAIRAQGTPYTTFHYHFYDGSVLTIFPHVTVTYDPAVLSPRIRTEHWSVRARSYDCIP